MGNKKEISIGLLGMGTVGTGVANVLNLRAEDIERRVGVPLRLKKVLVRNLAKARTTAVNGDLLTTEAEELLRDPDIDIIIEVMGGESPAGEYIERALSAGKHVVTANKELIAKRGPELFALARQNGVDLFFEASVGGGIPLIAPFKHDLVANQILSIQAIINGTTNYILTKMAREGTDFAEALKQAQDLGYAEADPTNDVEGIDAVYKLAILAMLGFHRVVRPDQIFHEGITRLAGRDFRYAKELGYAIKLLAIAREVEGALQVRVHPALVAEDMLLAKVDGVFNAVQVEGDLVGRVLFYGRGAGSEPTASAVMADVIDLAHNIRLGVSNRVQVPLDATKPLMPMAAVQCRYYLRMKVADRPGVLAQIAQAFGEHGISIASCIQKEGDGFGENAEIVITTHLARESDIQQALDVIKRLPVVTEIPGFIRVEV